MPGTVWSTTNTVVTGEQTVKKAFSSKVIFDIVTKKQNIVIAQSEWVRIQEGMILTVGECPIKDVMLEPWFRHHRGSHEEIWQKEAPARGP